jgi:hypothetical protein
VVFGMGRPFAFEAALPAGVNVNVAETVGLDTGRGEGVGLSGDVGLGEKAAVNGLLTESAPAKIGSLANTIHPPVHSRVEGKCHTGGEEKQKRVFAGQVRVL